MSYNVPLTRFLTGASDCQLSRLVKDQLLVPEVSVACPRLYSFLDVLAIRAAVKLRKLNFAQPIREALAKLEPCELVEGLEVKRFSRNRTELRVWYHPRFKEAANDPDWWRTVSLADIYRPFTTAAGVGVPALLKPSKGIEIHPLRKGGKPTIAGTQLLYQVLLELDQGGVTREKMFAIHQALSASDIENAKAFHLAVYGIKGMRGFKSAA